MSHDVAVDPRIWALRADFVVSVVHARGLHNGPSDAARLRLHEERARALLGGAEPEAHPHVAAWRDAYRAFGAKPQRTPSSVEALLKRVAAGEGLPEINRIVDLYNAVSAEFVLPVGGEDHARISGVPRLTIADGTETFDTVRAGEPVLESPAAREVVWRDDAGVTCRRWNWRQCVRTRLTEESTDAFFVLERLEPLPLADLDRATDALVDGLREMSPGAAIERRTILSPNG